MSIRLAAFVAAVVFLASACSGGGGPRRDSSGNVVTAGDESVFDVRKGDCFTPPTNVQAEIQTLHVVPCTSPHTQEAFAVVPYTKVDAYPGDQALTTFADGACLQRYQDYVGVSYQDSKLFYTYLLPSARSWQDGKDHDVLCIVTTTGDLRSSTVHNSNL